MFASTDIAPRTVDLTLPRSWGQCSTAQLEQIAATILKHTLLQDRYHPFDWSAVKAELFFLLAKVDVIGTEATEQTKDTETGTTYICRHKKQEFPLETWQVQSFIDQHLKWLDDQKQPFSLRFPYPTLISSRHLALRRWHGLPMPAIETRYHAPAALLQDFRWYQYRHLQEHMEQYIKVQNQIVQTKEPSAVLAAQLMAARQNFLTVLFHCERCPHRVEKINDVQWQVILWWWHGLDGQGGMMGYLMKHYPRVFKPQDTGSRRRRKPAQQQNPLDIYVSIVATMQAENHLTEEEVNNQTFHVILEQLERLARKNEELERISKKHK